MINGFDWTTIVIAFIGLITTICVTLITKQLLPWLKEKNLYQAALIGVDAAEAMYGRYHGDAKLEYAINSLKIKGFDVETLPVIDALKAAWKQLDMAMIADGLKDLPEENEE